MANPENLAIIIPTAGKRLPLLKALCRHLTEKSVGQIVVMDNSHVDSCVYEVATSKTLIVLYSESFNWSKINNSGAKYYTYQATIFGFLNDDLEVIQDDWLDKILEAFEDETIGGVSPVVELPDGSVPGPAVKIDRDIQNFVATGEVKPGIFDVPAIAGPALFIRRSLFEDIGGFDEDYHITHSDGVMGLRIAERSRCVVHGDSRIRHYERSSRGPDDPQDWETFKRKELR
ncbi:MAG: hypothetical protein K0041_05265, partial [Acidithiobacillus sp.]|nr:hypothetical protein [Acidithiobacillus sp.]